MVTCPLLVIEQATEGSTADPVQVLPGKADAVIVDWGLPGFGETQITKNRQQLLAAGRAPHGRPVPCWPQSQTLGGQNHESDR